MAHLLSIRSSPTFSVIIPTYRRELAVIKAARSVLQQTIRPVEIIIVDDSDDNNLSNIIHKEFGSDVICVPNIRKKGPSGARNTGIMQASGDWIAFLDDDDYWMPRHIENLLETSRRLPDCRFVAARFIFVDSQGRAIKMSADVPREIGTLLLGGNVVGTCSCVAAERALIHAAGLFDESISYAEDWDLWLRLTSLTSFASTSAFSVSYVVHSGPQLTKNPKFFRSGLVTVRRTRQVQSCRLTPEALLLWGTNLLFYLRSSGRSILLRRVLKKLISDERLSPMAKMYFAARLVRSYIRIDKGR